jgi:hypothetical protein
MKKAQNQGKTRVRELPSPTPPLRGAMGGPDGRSGRREGSGEGSWVRERGGKG